MSPIDMKIWMGHLSGGRYSAVVVQNANTTLPCNWLAGWLALHAPSRITHCRNRQRRDLRAWRHAECVAQDVLRIGSRGRDWSFNSSMLLAPLPASPLSFPFPLLLCVSNLCFVCLVWQIDFSRIYRESIFRKKYKSQYFLITFR